MTIATAHALNSAERFHTCPWLGPYPGKPGNKYHNAPDCAIYTSWEKLSEFRVLVIPIN